MEDDCNVSVLVRLRQRVRTINYLEDAPGVATRILVDGEEMIVSEVSC